MILAAGGGSRFEPGADAAHKLLAPARGRPLVLRAVEAALEAGIGEVWAITGAIDLSTVLPDGVRLLANDRWAEGQATSLQRALAEAGPSGLDAIVVGLGDQPSVTPAAWRAVAAARSPVAVATYGGRRGHPVKLGRPVWALLPAAGDSGARGLMADRPDLVHEVPCQGDPVDIDTREDLERWS